MYLDIIAALH